MATRLDIEDLGNLLSIPSARRTARPMPPVGADIAMPAAGARVGTTAGNPDASAAEARRRRLLTESTNARASIYGGLLAARTRYADDPDYTTLARRWSADAEKAVDDGLAGVSNEALRNKLARDIAVPLAEERGAIEKQALRGVAAAHAELREKNLHHLVQSMASDPSDALLSGGINAYHAMIDNAAHRGFLTPDDALAEKRRGALALCEGEYAAMARRDPARAIRELQEEAVGHPLLVHLPQERKDALIEEARQRQAANDVDAELADQRRQQQERRGSDEAEAATVADLFGDSPSVTGNGILDNAALSEEARQRMLGAVARHNQAEPDASVSQATALDLLARIRRPDGDADKIAGIGPLLEAYNRGALSRADFRFAAKQLADAGTPAGELLARHRQAYIRAMAAQAEATITDRRDDGDAEAQDGAAVKQNAQDGAAVQPAPPDNAAVAPGAQDNIAADASTQTGADAEADGRDSAPEASAAETGVAGDSAPESTAADGGTPQGDAEKAGTPEAAANAAPTSQGEAAAAVNAGGTQSEATSDADEADQHAVQAGQPSGPAIPSLEAAGRSWLYGLERDIDYRIDRYRRDGKDPLDLFDPSKSDYVGKSAAMLLPLRNGPALGGLTQLVQNSPAAPVPPAATYGPPLPVQLPNGKPVLDPNTNQPLMSPNGDVRPVAEEGRKTGIIYRDLLQSPEWGPAAAYAYLVTKLFSNLFYGGTFDYQRTGHGPVVGYLFGRGFNYISSFKPVSNFNVGLFCQQAGLTLDETLGISGRIALLFSGTADPTKPYGLPDDNRQLITEGYKIGASGAFGPGVLP